MNREIIFRGKRIDNDKFVFGDLVRVPKDIGDYNNPPSIDMDWYITNSHLLTHEWVLVYPESVSQFTGKSDRAGTFIYENDIVYGHKNGNALVQYSETYSSFDLIFTDGTSIRLSDLSSWIENNALVVGNNGNHFFTKHNIYGTN